MVCGFLSQLCSKRETPRDPESSGHAQPSAGSSSTLPPDSGPLGGELHAFESQQVELAFPPRAGYFSDN